MNATRSRFVVTLVTLGLAATTFAAGTPVKGLASIYITPPAIKVVGNDVVTVIKVKNVSKGDIAGLRLDEYWYDKAGETIPGSTKTLSKPLEAGAIATFELHTPKNPKMDKSNYVFSHANGKISARSVPKVE